MENETSMVKKSNFVKKMAMKDIVELAINEKTLKRKIDTENKDEVIKISKREYKPKIKKMRRNKHHEMVENRMKEWYASKHKNLTVETMIHRLNNGNLLSMRQFQPDNRSRSKKALGDIIILDCSSIDTVIKHLEKAKESLSTSRCR